MQVKACELVKDFEIYPRESVNGMHVSELSEVLRSGQTLPPLLVDKKSKRIVDGFHRHTAFINVFGPDEKLGVTLREYATEAEMFLDAVKKNGEHGKRLTKVDYVRITNMGKKYGYEIETVAALLGIRPERLEIKCDRRTAYGPDGSPLVLRAGMEHLAGSKLTQKQVKANRKMFGLNPVFFAKRLCELIEAKALPLKDERLAMQLMRLKDHLVAIYGCEETAVH